MKNNIIILSFLVLAASVVQAAVVVELGSGDCDHSRTTWSFSDLGDEVAFTDAGSGGASLTENTLSGIDGSFSLTLSATKKTNTLDAASWSFGAPTAFIHMLKPGWGIKSDEVSDKQMSADEAFLLCFDVSNLNVHSGNVLVFSILVKDRNSYQIYRRTAQATGEIAARVEFSHSGYSPPVPITGIMEFAITDTGYDGGANLRITGLSIDVIPEAELELKIQQPEPPQQQKPLEYPTETIGFLF